MRLITKIKKGLTNKILSEIDKLIHQGLVPITYADDEGQTTEAYPNNPNGSLAGIAGLTNTLGTITLMMPHPERMIDKYLSSNDGNFFFENLIENLK